MKSTDDPMTLFREWFEAAHDAGLFEPTAASLATVGLDGRPTARMVLVRGLDDRGFVFYTNFQSRKGQELGGGRSAGTAACLCFWWPPPLFRQVRIEGTVEPVSSAEADAYWDSRPRGHQVAAWASPQSTPLPGGRDDLERRFREMDSSLPAERIPRPPYWSGFRVIADAIEFWEGRENRLHVRTLYRREGNRWTASTLAP